MNIKTLLQKSKTFSGYKLQDRIQFRGLNVSVENKKGSIRSGVDKNGQKWSIKMNYPYGYIRMTEGTDGDHIDCYIGPNELAESVYIIHQNDPDTGKYDEDKVMLGFDSASEAKKAYLSQYDRPGFFGSMTILSFEQFKDRALATMNGSKKTLKALLLRAAYQGVGKRTINPNPPPKYKYDYDEPKKNKKSFKQWFNDSKVVDGKGNPLLVYHGTGSDFENFSVEYSKGDNPLGRGHGIYFTRNWDIADDFAEQSAQDTAYEKTFGKKYQNLYWNNPKYIEYKKKLKRVVPAYLNIKKPFIVNKDGLSYKVLPKEWQKILRSDIEQELINLQRIKNTPEKQRDKEFTGNDWFKLDNYDKQKKYWTDRLNTISKLKYNIDDLQKNLKYKIENRSSEDEGLKKWDNSIRITNKINELIRQQGYDGIVGHEEHLGSGIKHEIYIVFKPDQIWQKKEVINKAESLQLLLQKAAYRGKKGYIRTGTSGNYKYKKIKPKIIKKKASIETLIKKYNTSEDFEKNHPDKIIYRTEIADPAYKGKSVWGDGKYYGLNKEIVGEMQLNPDSTKIQHADMSKVDTYVIPDNLKIKTVDISQLYGDEFNRFPTGNKLKKQVLKEGYDAIKLITGDDLNLGGDQLIVYKNVDQIKDINSYFSKKTKEQTFVETASELGNKKSNIKLMVDEFGSLDLAKEHAYMFHASEKNYKPFTYYHVTTKENAEAIKRGGFDSSKTTVDTLKYAAGAGIYVGKDKRALNNFYNLEGDGVVLKLKGNPKFWDLTEDSAFKGFSKDAREMYPDANQSDALRLMGQELGYDGIRYYDPLSTGEEFVVFDPNSLEIESDNKANKLPSELKHYKRIQKLVLKRLINKQINDANSILKRKDQQPKKYELKIVKVSDIIPSQSGEDYINDSSKNLAKNVLNKDSLPSRLADIAPIVVDENNQIVDGNHRHAAHVLNNEDSILALVPISGKPGSVKNIDKIIKAKKSFTDLLIKSKRFKRNII